MLINMAKNKTLTAKRFFLPMVIGGIIGLSLAGYQIFNRYQDQENKFAELINQLPITYQPSGDQLIDISMQNKIVNIMIIANKFDMKKATYNQKVKRFEYIKQRTCSDDAFYQYFYKSMLEGSELIINITDSSRENTYTIRINSSSCQ